MSRLDVNSLKELLPTEESFPRWIEFSEFEKMEWVNKLLRKMWPVLDEVSQISLISTLKTVVLSFVRF
jgi:Ca2+-dependent lipid-binding protein